MSISVQCPGCGKRLSAKPQLIGKRVKCPSCGQALVVPAGRPPSQPEATSLSPLKAPPANRADSPAAPAQAQPGLTPATSKPPGEALLDAIKRSGQLNEVGKANLARIREQMQRSKKAETPEKEKVAPKGLNDAAPRISAHADVKELIPILCEHCSASHKVQGGAIGLSIRCDKCQKMTCVALLDTSKLPGPHGPGEPGCVPGFRGDPAHYRAVFEAGARAQGRAQQLLAEGVLPGLVFDKMQGGDFGVKGEFAGGLKLAGANLQGALFFRVGKAFESADLRGANLEGVTWHWGSLENARFDGANMRRCAIGGGICFDSDHVSFRDADLAGSTVNLLLLFDRTVDFTGANLEKAVLNTGPEHTGCVTFKNARMKGCKVREALLPQLSERQRAEVEVMVPVGHQTLDEREMASAHDRRFRSVPILASKSQVHSAYRTITTVTQTTYNMSDVREHVLKNCLLRHLLTWEWPLLVLVGAVVGFAVQVAIEVGGAGSFLLDQEGGVVGLAVKFAMGPQHRLDNMVVSAMAALVGALVGFGWNSGSRRLYRRQAWKDRGWKFWQWRPKLHIVFEHEWRDFTSRLR